MKGNFVSSSSREQLLFHFHRLLLRHLSHPHFQRSISHTDTCMPRSQTEHITSSPEGAPPWGARPPQRRRRSESLARASAHVLGCRVNRFATCAWAPFFFFFALASLTRDDLHELRPPAPCACGEAVGVGPRPRRGPAVRFCRRGQRLLRAPSAPGALRRVVHFIS